MWDPLEAAWERGFAHFEKLSRDANGYRTVAQRHVMKDGYRLGHWHDNQRQAYKRGTLKTDRIQRLEEAGMVWDSREMAWEEGLDHFVAFDADSMGERRVPQGFVTADGFKLGWWLDTQRRARRRGALSEARIGQLEASGIVWDPQEMAWEIGLAHFLALPPDELGRRMVPQTHTTPDDGFKLGWWQHAQSAARKRGELSDERIARLDAAGFVWDRVEAVWDDAFAQFKALPLNAQGLRTVPQTLVVHNELRLGRWAAAQRQAYKRGALSAERVAKLEAAGMDWDPLETAWEEAYARFLAHPLDAHGRRIVPQRHLTDDGFRLGAWQDAQRKRHNAGVLSAERIMRLEAAGIVWSPKEVAWEVRVPHSSHLSPLSASLSHLSPPVAQSPSFPIWHRAHLSPSAWPPSPHLRRTVSLASWSWRPTATACASPAPRS